MGPGFTFPGPTLKAVSQRHAAHRPGGNPRGSGSPTLAVRLGTRDVFWPNEKTIPALHEEIRRIQVPEKNTAGTPGTFMGKTGFPIIKWEFEYFISYIICLIKNPAFMLCKVNIYQYIHGSLMGSCVFIGEFQRKIWTWWIGKVGEFHPCFVRLRRTQPPQSKDHFQIPFVQLWGVQLISGGVLFLRPLGNPTS